MRMRSADMVAVIQHARVWLVLGCVKRGEERKGDYRL